MTEVVDQREKLFLEFKESNSRLEEIRERLREHSQQMEFMHKEASDIEREFNFLRRAVHLVLVEDLDPVMAKFQVSEEMKSDRTEKITTSGIGYAIASIEEDSRYRRGKLRRMVRAIREIWHERY